MGQMTDPNKPFPIQQHLSHTAKADGYPTFPRTIPWWLAELAYGTYSSRYGTNQSLEELARRGGFGPEEMDMYCPDWRDRLALDGVMRRIEALTKVDMKNKSIFELAMSAVEELGEFARALKVERGVFGNAHKDPGDGSIVEAADLVISALALYYARCEALGKPTDNATLSKTMMEKLDKWEKSQMNP